MILVHVIPDRGTTGDRHEEHFPAGTTDADIVAALTQPRPNPRADGWLPPLQDGYGPLRLKNPPPNAPNPGMPYLTHPGTVVAVGHSTPGARPGETGFAEDRRLWENGAAAGGGQ